jgi:hypothetical protein
MALRAFWVILVGETPTSFRAKVREDLVPTLRQLQRTQDKVTLRWFERGRIWDSPQQAIGVAKLASTTARERRSKEWRPGGDHRDPKARFELTRDQKRAKFKREHREERTREQHEERPRERREERMRETPRHRPDDRSHERRRDHPRDRAHDRPFGKPRGERPDQPRSPFASRPAGPPGPPRPPKAQKPDGPRFERPESPFGSRGSKRPWNKPRGTRQAKPRKPR